MDKKTKAKILRSEKKLDFYRLNPCPKCGGKMIETLRSKQPSGQWHDFKCSRGCYYFPSVYVYMKTNNDNPIIDGVIERKNMIRKRVIDKITGRSDREIIEMIYEKSFSPLNSRSKDNDGSYQCHSSVNFIKDHFQNEEWYGDLEFHQWDELNWKLISKKLEKNKKIFNNVIIDFLIDDIIDGSVNGHSFVSYKGYFIDPYLKSLNVAEEIIQEFDKWFLKFM